MPEIKVPFYGQVVPMTMELPKEFVDVFQIKTVLDR